MKLLFLIPKIVFSRTGVSAADSPDVAKALAILDKYAEGKTAIARFKKLQAAGMKIEYLPEGAKVDEGATFSTTSNGKVTLQLRKDASLESLAAAIAHETKHIDDLLQMINPKNINKYSVIARDEAPVKNCLRESTMANCHSPLDINAFRSLIVVSRKYSNLNDLFASLYPDLYSEGIQNVPKVNRRRS